MIDEIKIEEATKEYISKRDIFLKCGCHMGFKAGIDWFKKNLWHDAKEQPLNDELMLVQRIKHRLIRYDLFTWDSFSKRWEAVKDDYNITKWCYLKDLI